MDAQILQDQILRIIRVVRARQLQAAGLICLLLAFITQHRLSTKKHANIPTRDVILQRRYVREEMLRDLSDSGKCRELIRMSERAYMTLCNILKHDGGLQATQRMSVEEQVARFLHIVGNDMRNRLASWIYCRSRSTTSRCFHRVLRAILSLESHYQVHKLKLLKKEMPGCRRMMALTQKHLQNWMNS
ncbi:uncharacterized protein LOC118488477 [Helianthus annuus]|uniref:uncharacterized protein LOC118488477 n=1 Tax=Helianthus annuus TaxID=4232 RepID=UPI00165305CD|nr:uncharacterized protein LOC118488477 [Helianthus annuus]